MSYIKLAGSVTLEGQIISNSYEDVDLTYGYVETTRTTDSSNIDLADLDRPLSYVSFTGDINAFVTSEASGDATTDDAWGLTTITLASTSVNAPGTVTLSDGTQGGVTGQFTMAFNVNAERSNTIQVGNIDINPDESITNANLTIEPQTTANWTYIVQAVVGENGVLTLTPGAYNGTQTFTLSSQNENTLYEQKLYASTIWTGVNTFASATATASGNDADTPTVAFNSVDADIALTQALNNEFIDYNGNTLISNITFTINQIDRDNESGFSGYANGKNKQAGDDLFITGDEVHVLNGNDSLSNDVHLNMVQYDGKTTDVITVAFGVRLIQS
jgi:hypothetical protein